MLGATRPPTSAPSRVWRVLLRAVQICICVALLYQGTLNLLLATPLLRRIANQGRAFELNYRKAYSLIPGRIHVEGLTLRGADTHVEWYVVVDSATFGSDLLGIVRRRFHATFVRASGVAVRIRMLESVPDPGHDAHVPPIPGFEVPALIPIGPQIEVTDANYNLVTVDLEDVEALRVREVWVDRVALTGDLDVHGRWLFEPVRRLEVGPATVDIRTLSAAQGPDRAILESLRGHVDATIEPFDLRRPIREIVSKLSVRADLAGTLRGTELANMLTLPADLAVTEGDAALTTHGRAVRGVLVAGSTWDLEAPVVTVRGLGLQGTGASTVRGHVEDDHGRALAIVDLKMKNIEVGPPGATEARIAALEGSLRTSDVDFNHDPTDLNYDLAIEGLTAARLDPWLRRFGANADLHGGAVSGEGQWAGSFMEHSGSGAVELTAAAVSFASPSLQASGDVHARAAGTLAGTVAAGTLALSLSQARLRVGPESLSGRASADASSWKIDFGGPTPAIQTGPLNVSVHDVEVATVAPSPLAVVGRVAEAEASTANLTFGSSEPDGVVAFDVERVDLLSLAEIARLVPHPDWLKVDGGAGTASAKGSFDVGRELVAGECRLGVQALEVEVGSKRVRGDVYVTVHAATKSGHTMDLAGTRVDVSHLSGAGDKDWWARASLARGDIVTGPGPWSARGDLSLEARDARPVDAFVSTLSGVPNWVLGIFAMPDLKVHTEVRLAARRVAIHDLEASGGSTNVQLEFRSQGSETRGLVFARHGELEVGLGIGQVTPHIVLLAVHEWFASRKAALDLAAADAKRPGHAPDSSGSTDLATLLQPTPP